MTWTSRFLLLLLIPQFLALKIDFNDSYDPFGETLSSNVPVLSCDKRNSINLSNVKLSTIPTNFITSDKILNVNLSYNSISSIPNSFYRDVPNLECLDLTSNTNSRDMSLQLNTSLKLKILILNRIFRSSWSSSSPCSITMYFPELHTLHLNEINGCTINESLLTGVPQLTTLFLMDYINNLNGLYMPDTLRHLHLEGTCSNEYFINRITNVQSLYLGRCRYTNNFRVAPNAVKLEKLSCRFCDLDLSSIYQFFEISRNALKELDLSQNHIRDLPDNILNQAISLEILNMSNNALTRSPSLETLSHLRVLVLNHNQIHQVVDTSSTSLEVLSLRNNSLLILNDTAFDRFPALRMLDLSDNKLAFMPSNWTRSLNNLEILNLESNLFTRLRHTSLTTTNSDLTHLLMRGNPIEMLHEEELLDLSNCTLHLALKL